MEKFLGLGMMIAVVVTAVLSSCSSTVESVCAKVLILN